MVVQDKKVNCGCNLTRIVDLNPMKITPWKIGFLCESHKKQFIEQGCDNTELETKIP